MGWHMEIGLGIVVVVLSLLCWGGQVIAWLAPRTAVRLTLMEAEEDVEPTYWADIRGEATWDSLTLWTLLVAGLLLIADNPVWAYFGLVGGGMYLYFAGRGILTRIEMRRRKFRVGKPQNLRLAYALLVVWGVVAAITIIAAAQALPVP
jgi:hypothetical protein